MDVYANACIVRFCVIIFLKGSHLVTSRCVQWCDLLKSAEKGLRLFVHSKMGLEPLFNSYYEPFM